MNKVELFNREKYKQIITNIGVFMQSWGSLLCVILCVPIVILVYAMKP